MGSSRFPGKILKNVCGIPSIIYQIKRINLITNKNIKLVVATTTRSKDDVLCNLLEENNVEYYRGSENNVLQRFLDCANTYKADYITRINADCPLICPKIIKNAIKIILSDETIDYASTILEETFPLGMHVECFKKSILDELINLELTQEDMEHVTPRIYKNNQKYSLFSIRKNKISRNFRLTVDYEIDLKVINEIASSFLNYSFNCDEIIEFLEKNPQIASKNIGLMRNQKI